MAVAVGGGSPEEPSLVLRSPRQGARVQAVEPIRIEWTGSALDGSSIPPRPVSIIVVEGSRTGTRDWEPVATVPASQGWAEWTPWVTQSRVWLRLATPSGLALSPSVEVRVVPALRQVGMAGAFAFAAMSDGTLRYWGSQPDQFGTELFEGRPYYVTRPVRALRELRDIAQVAGGGRHALFVRGDGTVLLWGAVHGYGDGAPNLEPVPIPEVGVARLVATSLDNNFVVDQEGQTWGFGGNFRGSLGDGTDEPRNRPVRIPALDESVAIEVGELHGLALRPDGTVLSWGRNGAGQLGDGSQEDRYTPQPIPGLDHVVAISARGLHSLALRDDGTVWSWGSGFFGQLGNGQNGHRTSPVPVDGIESAVAIGSGATSSYALLADGTLLSWGANDSGQLGIGRSERMNVPMAIPHRRFSRLWAEGNTVHVLTVDGDWYAWGGNYNNVVGDGTGRDRFRPRRIHCRGEEPPVKGPRGAQSRSP